MNKPSFMKKRACVILACILLSGVFFLGNGFASAESAAPAPERNLRISVACNQDAGFTTIGLEQGNYKKISYLDVDNVTIHIDGTSMKLEDALRDGEISVEELVACARQDASLGLCREVATSHNGLTEFTYRYGEFTLRHVYDLYETPDGRQHLVADFLIYDARSEPHFLYSFDETGKPIDYEDWGLTFEITRLEPSGVTVACSQSGGQQMGKLNVDLFLLYRKNPATLDLEQVPPLAEEGVPLPRTGITMGGTTELSFDFAGRYGELPAGDYVLSLQIVDDYNQEEVPSLMRNYYDAQWYGIEFSLKS